MKYSKTPEQNSANNNGINTIETFFPVPTVSDRQWFEEYIKVLNFKNIHSRLPLLIRFSIQTNKFQKRENSLGIWLSGQRRHHRKQTLSVTKTQLLDDIGLVWDGNKVKLNLMYDRLMVFLEVNKKLPDSKEAYIENQNFIKIFPDFEQGNLKGKFKELLIKYDYEKWILRQRNRLTWDEIYDKVVEFRDKFKKLPTYKGKLAVKTNTLLGKLASDPHLLEQNQLGSWLHNQKDKARQNQLSSQKREKLLILLGSLDHRTIVNNQKWENKYLELKEYVNSNGGLPTLSRVKTLSKVKTSSKIKIDKIDNTDNLLAYWLRNQINWANGSSKRTRAYPADYLNKLQEIGVSFSIRKRNKNSWDLMFEALKLYMSQNQNQTPPYQVAYSTNGHLGNWCFRQRKLYRTGKLKQERLDKLQSIEFSFLNTNRKLSIIRYHTKQWKENYFRVSKLLHESIDPMDNSDLAFVNWYTKNLKLFKNNKLADWKNDLWLKLYVKIYTFNL